MTAIGFGMTMTSNMRVKKVYFARFATLRGIPGASGNAEGIELGREASEIKLDRDSRMVFAIVKGRVLSFPFEAVRQLEWEDDPDAELDLREKALAATEPEPEPAPKPAKKTRRRRPNGTT